MLRLRHPVALLLISLLILAGALRSYSAPDPVAADASNLLFSAARAEAILRNLLQENLPHVAGSPQNAVVRDRIAEQLRAAGYQPEIQSRYHCNVRNGACGPVDNILAVKPGAEGKQALMLSAHYDSVWAGAGAADNGAGVAAVLEIARMAADFPPFVNDIVFLFSDAEELGLIGADAFAEHHPLFEKVRTVINLEARGVSGPSVMFETGQGNRSLIRVFSKNVERPVANSLAYEMYRRMPNDTDFSVYKRQGRSGLNFAFVQGVAGYHSTADNPERLDPGSLQHHGDNAWRMLQALGDRNLAQLPSREDAGYMDLFAGTLLHYPVSITGGLALVLGVWAMLAIGLAFRREFRFWQLRWGLLAIPVLLLLIPLSGYLLSWPLGRWPELHPLGHPYPWVARLTLFAALALCLFTTLRLFLGRVSACAWMMLGWGLLVGLAITTATRLPSASHIVLLPLVLFATGSVVDLLRRKSPAPLLVASLLGFAGAALISFYHFFMLGVVMNFDRSHFMMMPLALAALLVMPMLLAWSERRELSWKPAKWLSVAVLAGCFIHLSLPGFTPEHPRPMTLLYSEKAGQDRGHLLLESPYGRVDASYAAKQGFNPTALDRGLPERVERPTREIPALNLPPVEVRQVEIRPEGEAWRRTLRVVPGADTLAIRLVIPGEVGLAKAWLNGQPALDTALQPDHEWRQYMLRLTYPAPGPSTVELLTSSAEPFGLSVISRHPLPIALMAPFTDDWPDDARQAGLGPRAEKIQHLRIGVDQPERSR
ncbi:MAG: M28 family peptidase [Xanthomonadales bacterium]|nr:M28 family peptidase [Xanthomonadales bacterium]